MDYRKYKPLRVAMKSGFDPDILHTFSFTAMIYKKITVESCSLSENDKDECEMIFLGHIQTWLIEHHSLYAQAVHHITKAPYAFQPVIVNIKTFDRWEKIKTMMTRKEALEKAVTQAIEIMELKKGTWINQ